MLQKTFLLVCVDEGVSGKMEVFTVGTVASEIAKQESFTEWNLLSFGVAVFPAEIWQFRLARTVPSQKTLLGASSRLVLFVGVTGGGIGFPCSSFSAAED